MRRWWGVMSLAQIVCWHHGSLYMTQCILTTDHFLQALRHSLWQLPSQYGSCPGFGQCRCYPYHPHSHCSHCGYYFAAHQQIITNLTTESDAIKTKANYFTKIGHKVCVVSPLFCLPSFWEHIGASGGGLKEDPWDLGSILCIWMSFFFSIHKLITTDLTQAEKHVPASSQLSAL